MKWFLKDLSMKIVYRLNWEGFFDDLGIKEQEQTNFIIYKEMRGEFDGTE